MSLTMQDVMTHDVTVGEQADFRDVVLLLRKHDVSALPVVDDAGALVGIVTRGTCSRRTCAPTRTSARRSSGGRYPK